MAQGAMPDTISSDMHVFSGNTPGMPYLTWVMSKFLNMGFTLEQVVAMTTSVPAKVIGKIPKLGTLQVGAPGDVTILDVIEGPVEFVDTRNNKRTGKVHIKPVQTVSGGIAFGRPFIGNPDLPARLRENLPLAGFDPDKLYSPGPSGYADYPAHAAEEAATA